ncbi:MAG TPA: transaldolase [Acidimicrobiales bacterium]|nr:transaldolase [Acidimicrobiales bacterium]
MTRLHQLYSEAGQSPWLDNLSRDAIQSGRLANMMDDGIRGVTSNPTIFQKAMTGTDVYDADFARLLETGSVEQAFWEMATADVTAALEIFHPLYEQSGASDGFVSLEVSPRLAYDTDNTIKDARAFHERIAMPNLLVKIPATEAGVPAIRQMTSEGRNINVTLIFSLDRYEAVIEAYISGLEALAAAGGDVSRVHSVASFFVSRVDTEVDREIEAKSDPELLPLRGKAAVAQAKLAYQLFLQHFSGPRWDALQSKGAHRQRPLWASTSTKNPAYSDLLYVDNLIGPDTVNTMPDATIADFLDHGTVSRTVDQDVDQARADLDALAAAGIDMAHVSAKLEDEGVAAFSKSYDELLQALEDKANDKRAGAGGGNGPKASPQ